MTRIACPAATLGTALLGGLLLGQSIAGTTPAYVVATATGSTLAGLSAVRMATSADSFDARLLAALVCAVTGLVALVVMVFGLPGEDDGRVSLSGVLLLTCGIVVPVLLIRCRRLRAIARARPYAP